MPDVKISGLPAGTVTGASTVPAVTSGSTHRTTVSASTAAGLSAYSTTIANSTLSVGGATLAGTHIRATGSATGAGVWQTFYADTVAASDVGTARSYNSFPSTAAGTYTTTQVTGFFASGGTKGAGSTLTTAIGFFAHQNMAIADTVNYGFFGALPVNGSVNWNLYMNGTAPNYLNGNLRIGTATQVINTLSVFDVVGGRSSFTSNDNFAIALRNTTGGTFAYVGATTAGDMQVSAAGGGALFTVLQGGNVGVGTTAPLAKLDVNGNAIRIQTASTQATSAAAGNVGEIRWDDTYLYVRISTGWRRVALGAAF